MPWDYFISHASEDKDVIARPLAHALDASKFSVWYDEFTLRLGDSLFQSISQGLASSSFGIVILSPAFMEKAWTQNELGGIWARETASRKLLLPVWHNVSAAEVAERMPMLADRVAVSTAKGLQHVAEQIVRASFPDRIEQLPLSLQRAEMSARTRDTIRTLVESGAPLGDLRLFLSAHQELVPRSGILIPAYKVEADKLADFVAIRQDGITGPMQMHLISLGPCAVPTVEPGKAVTSFVSALASQLGERKVQQQRGFNDYLGAPYVGEYGELLRIAGNAVRLLTGNPPLPPGSSLGKLRDRMGHEHNIHMPRPDLWSARLLVLMGRRDKDTLTAKNQIASKFEGFVEVASYDRLWDSPR